MSAAPRPFDVPVAVPAPDVELLHDVVRAVSSSLELPVVLSSVVELVTRAVGCHACYVFLADQSGRMVLEACSSERYADSVGKVVLEPGEGLAGWVARRRMPVFIAEDALADPRVRILDQFEEHKYQSLVSLPLIGKGGEVFGVIAAHGAAPREFTAAEQRFLLSSAALAAGAIENARLYGETSRRVDVLERLVQLSRSIAEGETIDVLLRDVCSRLLPLLGAASCRLFLRDDDHARLRLRAYAPPGSCDGGVTSIGIEDVGAAVGPDRHGVERVARLLGDETAQAAEWLFQPLLVSGELLGLLAVRGRGGRRFGSEDRDLAATAMAQAAVAVEKIRLLERLEERNLIKDFFDDLAAGDSAAARGRERRLSCDLATPRVVLIATRYGPHAAGADESGWAAALEARLAVRFPAALFDRSEHGLRALLPVTPASEAEARAWVREAHAAVSSEDLPVAVGLSEVCTGRPGYVAGFEEANLALSAAAVLHGRPSVMGFDELGPYKYLLRLPRGTRDRHCDRLRPLLEYDRDHGSQLFLTLEEYFRRRGRVAATAASLYIHPNTLRQRLGRIAALTGLDVEREDPLTLELAMKLVRLEDSVTRGT